MNKIRVVLTNPITLHVAPPPGIQLANQEADHDHDFAAKDIPPTTRGPTLAGRCRGAVQGLSRFSGSRSTSVGSSTTVVVHHVVGKDAAESGWAPVQMVVAAAPVIVVVWVVL